MIKPFAVVASFAATVMLLLFVGASDSGSVSASALDARPTERFIVQLREEPLSPTRGRSQTSARVHRLQAERQRLAAALSARGGRKPEIVHDFRALINAVVVDVAADDAYGLLGNPDVLAVFPDAEVHAFLDESVPLIGANQVWSDLGVTGLGSRVAVLDTGIDYTHPDLGGCLGAGCKVAGGYDFVNGDADPSDDHGHGTHVAATVAGDGVLTGVAPDAELLAYKVLGADGSGSTTAIIAAMEAAANPDGNPLTDDAADVISMSLGGFGNPDDAMSLAADAAVDAGIVVVVAAGNSGPTESTVASPGTSRNAITVGASDKTDAMAGFSSRGPVIWYGGGILKPDVVAPGVAICAAQWADAWAGSECVDLDHISIRGTSMATPHVAGAAALLVDAHPGWTPAEIKAALRNTALDIGSSPIEQGHGRIQVMEAAQLPHAPPVATIGTSGGFTAKTDIYGTASSASFSAYRLYWGAGTDPTSWNLLASSTSQVTNGLLYAGLDPNTLPPGRNTLRLEVEDRDGHISIDRALAYLPMPQGISGTVTDEISGDPVAGICVSAIGASFISQVTDGAGGYAFPDLPPGDYRVQFFDCDNPSVYAPEWWNDKDSYDNANLLTVPANGVVTANAQLAIGASISGTVTQQNTGAPVDACVNADSSSYGGESATNPDGSYTIGGLPAGSYKISFYDCGAPYTLAPEWWDNQRSSSSADPINVGLGDSIAGIDAALGIGGYVSGVVTNSIGDPLANVCVDVLDDLTNDTLALGYTNAGGAFLVGPLAEGIDKAYFRDCSFPQEHASEYWNDKASLVEADPISVSPGVTTTGIDATLSTPGSISGTVTDDANGSPVAGLCVSARNSTNWWLGSTATDGGGNYEIQGLQTEDFSLEFYNCSPGGAYVAEWYNNQPTFEAAGILHLGPNDELTGVDAAVTKWGSISGTVTDETSGEPIDGICVDSSKRTGYGYGSAQTDATGSYLIAGLSPGDYAVNFRNCVNSPRAYVGEFYDNKPDWGSADLVQVSPATETSGVDATLRKIGAISGTVTDGATGDLLEGICVSASNQISYGYGNTQTDADGHYLITGLAAGEYRVNFSDCLNSPKVYADEYYNDRLDWGTADLIPVTLGTVTSSIDAALETPGMISGTVTGGGTSHALGGICVSASNQSSYGYGNAQTNASGDYLIAGLTAGEYRVEFYDCANWPRVYASEYYDNHADWSSADLVTVSLGSEATSIDAILAVGGSISGRVTHVVTSNPLAGLCVNASNLSGAAGSALTNSTGSYLITGLPAGDYRVYFWDCAWGDFLGEYYDDHPDWGSAELVSISLGAETSSVDAALDQDADGDLIGNNTDNCPNWPNPTQAMPPWPVPASDSDCDGYAAGIETHVGTDASDHCNADTVKNNETVDAWPPDFDDNQIVNLSDVLAFNAPFGAGPTDANWNARFDIYQTATTIINVSDVLSTNAYFGLRCEPLP